MLFYHIILPYYLEENSSFYILCQYCYRTQQCTYIAYTLRRRMYYIFIVTYFAFFSQTELDKRILLYFYNIKYIIL